MANSKRLKLRPKLLTTTTAIALTVLIPAILMNTALADSESITPNQNIPSITATHNQTALLSNQSTVACMDSTSRVIVELINQHRVDSGFSALLIDGRLVASAQAHAHDMYVNNCHQNASCDGTPWNVRINSFGYFSPSSEFIGAGYLSAEDFVSGLLASEPHRDLLFERIGLKHYHIGAAQFDSSAGAAPRKWVIDFGGSGTDFEPEPCVQSCCDNPGDYNHDGSFNIADVTAGIARIFSAGPPPACQDEGDANGDDSYNIADVTYGIARIFSGGPAPVCGTTGT